MASLDNDDLPPDLADEILSINAIYGVDTLRLSSSSSEEITLELSPPGSHPLHPTNLLLSFPKDYPHVSAHVLGPTTIDPNAGKGAGHAAASHAQNVLRQVQVPDEPVVFALLAELETSLDVSDPQLSSTGASPGMDGDHISNGATATSQSLATSRWALEQAPTPLASDPRFALAHWTTATPLESHKSVFIGRAIRVGSAADVLAATNALLDQDKHVAKATHNMRAWRFRTETTSKLNANGTSTIEHQESDDDGESRAGAKILEVMAAMNVWEVLVVVSRWYGGTKLGPERFRLIGQCARDVLVLGGFEPQKGEEKNAKGKKKGK